MRIQKMKNRATIDDKKMKQIYNYIRTLKNGRQIEMMFDFSTMAMMRSINFRLLQIKDIVDNLGNIKDIIELDEGKNKGKHRCRYYVSDELKKKIKNYLNQYIKLNPEQYLFISQRTGKPYSRTYISTIFSNVYNVFGLDCSSHYGRRRGITKMIEKGINLALIQRVVCHKNVSTTSLYLNENENVMKNIVNQLDN